MARGLLKALCAVLIGLAAALLLAEVALRVAGFSYPQFWQADADAGWRLLPATEGWWPGEGPRDPQSFVRTNSEGLHDREHINPKPPGTFRIAILGDSYAEAFQVDMNHAFWAVMGRELAGCRALQGKTVEVVNFGVMGYGTAQELEVLKTRVWQYSPDLVVLEYFPGNDLSDNSRELRSDQDLPKPFFDLRNGKLILDDSFRDASGVKFRLSWQGRLLYFLLRHSRVMQLAHKVENEALVRSAPVMVLAAGVRVPIWEIQDLNPPANATLEQAWLLTEALIKAVRCEVANHHARFLMMVVSDPNQVYPDPIERKKHQQEIGLVDPFYANRRLDELANREGIPLLDLGKTFLERAEAQRIFFHGANGSGHWNVEGHQLAGELLAAKICEHLSSGQYTSQPSTSPSSCDPAALYNSTRRDSVR